jgi:hypothetical protein
MTDTPYYYIAKTDLETYLGVTLTANGIAQFNLMLPAMMAMVDQYCNRTWNFSNPVTQYWDALQEVTAPYAVDTFPVDYPPISDTPVYEDIPLAGGVISVEVGGIPWDMHFVYNYKTHARLWVRPMTIILPNPMGFKSVKMVYNSDAAKNCPAPVKQALIEWIARKVQTSPDAGKEAILTQTGTVQARFAQDKVGGIPDFVKLVLDQYRMPALDHF